MLHTPDISRVSDNYPTEVLTSPILMRGFSKGSGDERGCAQFRADQGALPQLWDRFTSVNLVALCVRRDAKTQAKHA